MFGGTPQTLKTPRDHKPNTDRPHDPTQHPEPQQKPQAEQAQNPLPHPAEDTRALVLPPPEKKPAHPPESAYRNLPARPYPANRQNPAQLR